jgi:hypothetical protein
MEPEGYPSLSKFNSTSAWAGFAVHSIATFASIFYNGGSAGGISGLCHKCMTEVQKRLTTAFTVAFHLILPWII